MHKVAQPVAPISLAFISDIEKGVGWKAKFGGSMHFMRKCGCVVKWILRWHDVKESLLINKWEYNSPGGNIFLLEKYLNVIIKEISRFTACLAFYTVSNDSTLD